MDVEAALQELRGLAAGLDADAPDLHGLGQLATDAVTWADGWTRADIGMFRDALDDVISDVQARRDALGAQLGGVARKGRAIRGYGRPMGVTQATTAQRVYRKG